ncbi:hypothetical protein SteCoe_38298 [Stentor coeruleus]|uniref:USP domain-containing protein n=1 Tax=Stentor coeruleus TaxID=5963 RepID=A0A1R2ALK0_9CILI|nr:hypothetical protein SteCoe_38298 [Stentor coeruleus]
MGCINTRESTKEENSVYERSYSQRSIKFETKQTQKLVVPRIPKLSPEKVIEPQKISPMHCGIANIGSSCYFNSLIQVFAHIDELFSIKQSNSQNQLFDSFLQLLSSVRSSNFNLTTHNANLLLEKLSKIDSSYNIGNQNDTKSLFTLLCGNFENKLSTIFIWKKILKLEHKATKKKCNNSEHPIPYFLFPAANNITTDAFQKTKMSYFLGENNQERYCNSCKIKSICNEIVTCIPALYTVFVAGSLGSSGKLSNLQSFKFNNDLYLLKSVIIRKGAINNGHSIALCNENNEWWYYDDTSISKFTGNIVSNIYILFYKRIVDKI